MGKGQSKVTHFAQLKHQGEFWQKFVLAGQVEFSRANVSVGDVEYMLNSGVQWDVGEEQKQSVE